jgi:hypothetical protein
MAKRMLKTTILFALCVATGGPVAAEGNWDLLGQLKPGDKVRVYVRGKEPIAATFGAVTPQTLQVVGNNHDQMDFTPAQVLRVERLLKRSKLSAAAPWIGVAAGFGAGFGIGWGAAASENSKRGGYDEYSRSRAGILGGVLGAPVVGLIGFKARGPGQVLIYSTK